MSANAHTHQSLPARPTVALATAAVHDALRNIPRALSVLDEPTPLLAALQRHDRTTAGDCARRLMIAAAMVHTEADERWVAEYLLRHRFELTSRRTPAQLVRAAHCAAEMEQRRLARRQTSQPVETVPTPDVQHHEHDDGASISDRMAEFASGVLGAVDIVTESRLREAAAIFMEVAERHVLQGGTGPAVLAMRSGARREARLVTHLRRAWPDEPLVAALVARFIAGGDGASITCAAAYWLVARNDQEPSAALVEQWRKALASVAAGTAAA